MQVLCGTFPSWRQARTRGRLPTMFRWSYLDASGEEIGTSQHFPDEEAAEDWMGNCWRDLLENGVEEVVLFDHERGRKLYRMGLGAE